jgi:hypothetical protein
VKALVFRRYVLVRTHATKFLIRRHRTLKDGGHVEAVPPSAATNLFAQVRSAEPGRSTPPPLP